MGWENVDLKGVNPGFDVVPEADYTYSVLPGAKIGNYGDLQIPVAIASEGDSNGRRLYLSYPDPTSDPAKFGWSQKAVKRLEQAVGLDQDEGETVLQWAQRLGENFAKFAGPVKHRKKTNAAEEEVIVADVQLFKVRPAA